MRIGCAHAASDQVARTPAGLTGVDLATLEDWLQNAAAGG
jgi:hypothetical protein